MAISVTTLYEDAAQECGAGVGNDKLTSGFVRACNRALDKMSVRADLATKHSHIANTDASVSTLSEHYGYMLYAGVIFYLRRMGFRSPDPKLFVKELDDSERQWNEALGEYVMDLGNIAQEVDEADVTKLGDVTA